MPIRDADMYGSNSAECTHNDSLMSNAGLECHYVHVTSNRGASGIDGLISTAIGFAAGCNKRVSSIPRTTTEPFRAFGHRTSQKS